MKIIVAGSRSITDKSHVFEILDAVKNNLAKQHISIDVIVEGEAEGVDLLAKKWANERGIAVEPFTAWWQDLEGVDEKYIRTRADGSKYNVLAGHQRNQRMIDYVDTTDLLIAIWDSKSTGTKDILQRARKKGIIKLIFT